VLIVVVIAVVMISIVVVTATTFHFFELFAAFVGLPAVFTVALDRVTKFILRLMNAAFTGFVSVVSVLCTYWK
jgi:hypothetical protein